MLKERNLNSSIKPRLSPRLKCELGNFRSGNGAKIVIKTKLCLYKKRFFERLAIDKALFQEFAVAQRIPTEIGVIMCLYMHNNDNK